MKVTGTREVVPGDAVGTCGCVWASQTPHPHPVKPTPATPHLGEPTPATPPAHPAFSLGARFRGWTPGSGGEGDLHDASADL